MTTTSKFTTVLAALVAAGGLAWLAKLAVIIATDGATTDTGAAAGFYLLGAPLLVVGSSAVGMLVAANRHLALRILAVGASPILFFASYMALDGIAKTLVGDSGPSWLQDEVGIGLTAAVWLGTGLLLLTRATRVPRHGVAS